MTATERQQIATWYEGLDNNR